MKISHNDPKDRKRRFLRGLNAMIGLDRPYLENETISLKEIINTNSSQEVLKIRNNLASIYCLEFTKQGLIELINSGITSGEFTEKYCPIVYKNRGRVDLNSLISSSILHGAIDLSEMDKAPKYGLNGSQWCDVAEGPCSCGAWH